MRLWNCSAANEVKASKSLFDFVLAHSASNKLVIVLGREKYCAADEFFGNEDLLHKLCPRSIMPDCFLEHNKTKQLKAYAAFVDSL